MPVRISRTMKTLLTPLLAVLLVAFVPMAISAPIKVLIIDGQNNHNWKAMTPFMKAQLEKSGRFTVNVSTTPPSMPAAPKAIAPEQKAKAEQAAAELRKQAAALWDIWRPDFAKYEVIISNYNGQDWPKPVQAAFEE